MNEQTQHTNNDEVYDLLSRLEPDEVPSPATALVAMQARLNKEHSSRSKVISLPSSKKASLFRTSRRRYAWVAAAAVLVLLLLLPNTGALANQFLALFQVQHFQPVTVNPQSLTDELSSDLRNFGYIRMQYNDNPIVSEPSQGQARSFLHFSLLLPSRFPSGVSHTPHFHLINSQQGTFIFNAAQARVYLAKTGQSNVHIPTQLDGATFNIASENGVIISYANACPQQASSKGETASQNAKQDINSVAQCSGGTPFYIAEIPSPMVRATGKASLGDLRDFMLSLPSLSPQMRALIQNVDLVKGVVPLPIPPQVQAQQTMIHNTPAVFLGDNSVHAGGVIWQEHGIIYMVATEATETEILNTANSLS